jgi:hypothetical protein
MHMDRIPRRPRQEGSDDDTHKQAPPAAAAAAAAAIVAPLRRCAGVVVPVTLPPLYARGKFTPDSGDTIRYVDCDAMVPGYRCASCTNTYGLVVKYGPSSYVDGRPLAKQLAQVQGLSTCFCPLCKSQVFDGDGMRMPYRAHCDHYGVRLDEMSRYICGRREVHFIRATLCNRCNILLPHGVNGRGLRNHFDSNPHIILNAIMFRILNVGAKTLRARIDELEELLGELAVFVAELPTLLDVHPARDDAAVVVDQDDSTAPSLDEQKLFNAERDYIQRRAATADDMLCLLARYADAHIDERSTSGRHIGVSRSAFLALHQIAFIHTYMRTARDEVFTEKAIEDARQVFHVIDFDVLRRICCADAADPDSLMHVLVNRVEDFSALSSALRMNTPAAATTFPHVTNNASGHHRVLDLLCKLSTCTTTVLCGQDQERTLGCFFRKESQTFYGVSDPEAYLLEISWHGACPISGVGVIAGGGGMTEDAVLDHAHSSSADVSAFIHGTVNCTLAAGPFRPLVLRDQFLYCFDAIVSNKTLFSSAELQEIHSKVSRSCDALMCLLRRVLQ